MCKEAALYTRGSFTLETAVILPLIAGFLVSILFFFRVMQVELEVYEALSFAGRKTAAIHNLGDHSLAELAVAEGYFLSAFPRESVCERYVKGGKQGVSLLTSDVYGDYVDLIAYYRISLPIAFFRKDSIWVYQESKSRKWTGNAPTAGEEALEENPIVYVTPYGEVYHLQKDCNYLDLSIRSASFGQIGEIRNLNAEKYRACSMCVAENAQPYIIYITDYGTVYHANLSCSGLKRTIMAVQLSELEEELPPCSKCVKKEKVNGR